MKSLEDTFLDTYNSHSDHIFRFIFFKLNDREKAKDCTQEVFMKAWIYISKNNNIENIKALLYKIAHNIVIDEYRKKGRIKESSLDLALDEGYDYGIDEKEALMDKMDGSKALLLLKSLPPEYSEILFMKYVEELSISEIAEATGKSNNFISVKINRGIRKLKEIVKEKWI